jgi:hypothetical protein
MALKFRRGTTAQKSGSLAFGEPYVNTTLGTLQIGLDTGDITLSATGTGSNLVVGGISGSSLDITGNAKIDGNLTLGGQLTIGDATSDTVNVVAALSSSLIPETDNVFDLGSATKSWRDLYVSTGSIKFVADGAVVSTLSTNPDGSQNFPNGLNITGSLIVSGSNVEFTRDWPAVGSESHFLRVAPFTSSTGRYYDGIGIGVEHWDDGTGTYEHSLQIHSWDDHDNMNYGAELNVGPFRTHMRIYPSGSGGSMANISVQDLDNGQTQALVYGDFVQIGAINAESIVIGNSGSVVELSGSIRANSITGSFAATNGVVSGSSQITDLNNSFSGLQTFNNINVNGTASFAYIQSTTGSSTSIGEAFIVLNENTPSSNFAGIKVVDSGSSFTTASFIYDGLNNNWVFEKANVGSPDTSVAIFGPISTGGLGTEVGLTQNKLPKAVSSHGHHIGDSNITDDGTTITLGSNTTITGTLVASGTTLISSSAQVFTNISGDITIASNGVATIGANTVALGTDTTGNYVASLVAGTGVSLSNNSGEGATPTVAIGQAVETSSNVRFASIGVGMNASGTSGRIDAANDVVAFSTSDIRLKENIVPIPNALEKISKISGNTYDWRAELKDVHGYEGNDVGVIAQEVEAVLPQLVQDRDNGYKAVKYDKLVALLIEGIKEQQTQIHNLTLEIENLKKNNSL